MMIPSNRIFLGIFFHIESSSSSQACHSQVKLTTAQLIEVQLKNVALVSLLNKYFFHTLNICVIKSRRWRRLNQILVTAPALEV